MRCLCDAPDGPMAIGYGGARGGGKSHWLLAQMGADDCQRVPGLKCLLLRKVGKANLEHFEDLRRRLFGRLNHEFSAFRGILSFANGSRIIAGHFQNEKDIDAYLGLEYDVIGIEEATTLTARKWNGAAIESYLFFAITLAKAHYTCTELSGHHPRREPIVSHARHAPFPAW